MLSYYNEIISWSLELKNPRILQIVLFRWDKIKEGE